MVGSRWRVVGRALCGAAVLFAAQLTPAQTLPSEPLTLAGGNPQHGDFLFNNTPLDGGATTCVSCHALPTGTNRIIIPGNLPHWWSSLDSDIRYLIYRPDPEGLQTVR